MHLLGCNLGEQLFMRMLLAAIVLVSALTSDAAAQWIVQKNKDPFSGGDSSMALSINANYGLGIRCDESTLIIVFLTPERAQTDQSVTVMELLSPQLLLKMDSGEVQKLTAEVDTVGDSRKFRFQAEASAEQIEMLAAAKSQIAVAVELNGKRFHTTTFSTAGSRRAIDGVAKGCNK